MPITLRPGRPEDADECGRICHEAFRTINAEHGFPPDFPSPEAAAGLLATMLSHPGFHAVVAEADGRIVGSNVLDERSAIAGVGPITVHPAGQNAGVGRALMQHVLERARARGFPGVRLVQAAFHNRSLALYTRLGFDAREPLSCVQGPPLRRALPGCAVRPATEADVAACNRLCLRVHGHTREGELRDAVRAGAATVVEREGRVSGYATGIAFFAHAVAEADEDLEALIAAAPAFGGPGFLVPTRNAALLRWCLANDLRIVQPMTLMSIGTYQEPRGAYLPSISF
ncbi:MAG TPA: GNAT family N-acetyltransferase [Candidatus Binatia bacterium]|nr:GNAT family N-acetyltransferase [Candidatus Binatia bacterium]